MPRILVSKPYESGDKSPHSKEECLNALNQQSHPHTAADAKRRQPTLCLALLHFVQQCRGNTNTGTTNRVTQSNRSAVRIHLVRIESQISIAGKHLGSERFVNLDQVNVFKIQILSGENRAHGRYRTNAHDLRWHTDNLVIDDAPEWLSV